MSRLTASSMSACVDGPNAWRSASRMSRSSSGAKSKKTSGIVGRDEVVDERDGHPAGLEPDGLLAVLEDAVVLAVRAGRARLAVADVGAGEVLELERDVLGDVAGPGPVAQPRDEAAAPAERAGVVLEGRQERDERVGEAGELVRRVLLEDAEVDEHADDRLAGPVVRAAQDARLEDPQGRGRTARRGRCGRLGGAVRPRAGLGRFGRLGHAVLPAHSTGWIASVRLGRPSSRRPRRRRARAGSASRRARAGAGRSGSRPAASGARRR